MLLVETGRNSVSQQGHFSGRLPGVHNKENTLALSEPKLKPQRELSTQDRGREAYLSDLVIFFFFFSFLKIQPSGLNLEVIASWNLDDMREPSLSLE